MAKHRINSENTTPWPTGKIFYKAFVTAISNTYTHVFTSKNIGFAIKFNPVFACYHSGREYTAIGK